MKLEDVKEPQQRVEKRTGRVDIRLLPSQQDYIKKNKLSPSLIMDKALDELGYEAPTSSEEIERLANLYAPKKTKSRGKGRGGKGNMKAQKRRKRRR